MGLKGHIRYACLALALTAAGTAAHAQEPLNIRIAWSTMPGHMIPVLYSKPEILRHYGTSYTVEPIRFRGSSPQLNALAANEVDLATLGPIPFALGIVNAQLDLVAVADVFQDGVEGYEQTPFIVKVDGGIETIEDVRGKRVATNAYGSAADVATRAMLLKHGIDPRTDVNMIEVNFPNMRAMFEEDKIDLAGMARPFSTQALASGDYKVLFTGGDAYGQPSQAVFLAGRQSVLEANREAMQDFFEDHVRALRWFGDPENKDEALQIVADYLNTSVDDLPALFTTEDTYRDPWVVPNIDGIQVVIDAAVDLEIVPRGVTVDPNYVDLSFIETARQRIEQE